jgi:hypothetical protein
LCSRKQDRAERIARGEIDEFDEIPAAPEVPAPFDEKQLKRLKASVDLAQARVDEHQKKMTDTVLVVPMQVGNHLIDHITMFLAFHLTIVLDRLVKAAHCSRRRRNSWRRFARTGSS